LRVFHNEMSVNTLQGIIGKTGSLLLGKEVRDPNSNKYTNVAELAEANTQSICFLENIKYLPDFDNSLAGLVLVAPNLEVTPKDNQTIIKVEKPYFLMMMIVYWWLKQEEQQKARSISEKASIHHSVEIGKNVHIGEHTVIEEKVIIGEETYIGANVTILNNVQIGKNCYIYPSVVIYDHSIIGDHVIIHSGAVIGADGFGFTLFEGVQVKIPQVGNVEIGDDVEIGANTCIDRATIGTTQIKANTKIDNLVQIAHNCKIEESTILCSQVGLAGNTHLGKYVYLAGQVGVAGHLKIADQTMVGAQSGVPSSLSTGQYFGYPVLPAFEQKKIMLCLKDLPQITRYIKKKMKEER